MTVCRLQMWTGGGGVLPRRGAPRPVGLSWGTLLLRRLPWAETDSARRGMTREMKWPRRAAGRETGRRGAKVQVTRGRARRTGWGESRPEAEQGDEGKERALKRGRETVREVR